VITASIKFDKMGVTFDRPGPVPGGWIPTEIQMNGEPPRVRWLRIGSTRLSEPLFADTVSILKANWPALPQEETGIEKLFRTLDFRPPVTPAGLVFHISRSGSNLICAGLRGISNAMVVSQALPITNLFAPYSTAVWPYPLDKWAATRAALLRSMADIFASYRNHVPEPVVIEFASWNILAMPAIRRIWPEVPCLVLIRNPVDVIASNLKEPSAWMVYRSRPVVACELFGWPGFALHARGMTMEEYCARVVGLFCHSAAAALSSHVATLDYEDIDAAAVRRVAAFFNLSIEQHHPGNSSSNLGSGVLVAHRAARETPVSPNHSSRISMAAIDHSARSWANESYACLLSQASLLPHTSAVLAP
jgi:hypothetical protein